MHDDIINSYLESLPKYSARANIESLEHLMKSVASGIGSQIKYTHLDPNRRIEVTKASRNTLEKALLVHLIHSINVSGLLLGANASSKVFKALSLDFEGFNDLGQNICWAPVSRLILKKFRVYYPMLHYKAPRLLQMTCA